MNDLFSHEPVKRCAMCHRTLPLSFFSASRRAGDGLQAYCKRCQSLYRMKHPTKEYKYNKNKKDILNLFDNGKKETNP